MPISTVALVLANVVPLAGALAFGWSIREIFALYWAENVVIGAFTVLRLLLVRPAEPRGPALAGAALAPFFCVHYGLFLVVHAVFVVRLVGAPDAFLDPGPTLGAGLVLLDEAAHSAHGLGLLALVASHGVSFVTNFLGSERTRAKPAELMLAPYARVVAMHLCLLAGGALLMASSSDASGMLLALLVGAKTAVDLMAHRAERRRFRRGAQLDRDST